jgi:hydroxymethylbilane synthase
MVIKIATRESQLALWQANEVARLLRLHHPELTVEILGMTTEGDRFLHASLASAGGKGLFVKELEQSLLENHTDIAVHSMKDVPYVLPEELGIHAILAREDPRDAFVSNKYENIDALPVNAVVGTSSTRREFQLRAYRGDLIIKPLRGNVNTRLAKLDDGQYDAIILASAGLKRLGFDQRIASLIDIQASLPAIGQGAVGIECRNNDQQTILLLQALNDKSTAQRVQAERFISTALSANCHLPIAAFAQINNDQLRLQARVGTPDGKRILHAEHQDHLENSQQTCQHVVDQLHSDGAIELIQSLNTE